MSFKREGNDRSWLEVLKKRRVAELFAEDIPEDEAHLLKNGRFACMVCSQRPVFDTVSMLAIHRQGKKHQQCAENRAAEKQELNHLKRKREHEHFTRHGKLPEWSTTGSDVPSHSSLLTSAPYDPRVKKPGQVKPHERRLILDLTPEATTSDSLPGHQVAPQTISQYRRMKKIRTSTAAGAKPYLRKNAMQSSSYTVSAETLPSQPPTENTKCESEQKISEQSGTDLVHRPHYIVPKEKKKKKAAVVYGPVGNEEHRNKMEQYLQARESGWKKDAAGQWIKEDGVEFDSDEEPPDLC